jgi:Ser-tRNA(Ala) deacylase AlaX
MGPTISAQTTAFFPTGVGNLHDQGHCCATMRTEVTAGSQLFNDFR